MRYIADLHLHSKYSRACSKDLDLAGNSAWAKKKGIQIVGTGDFTHPFWFKELKEKLIEAKDGLYKLPGSDGKILFMITTEVSCIYSQGDQVRRLHICLFVPNLETVAKINTALEKRGVNLRADGRPIMGLSAEELTKIVIDANPDSLVIPAHAWTPWFSVFGSKSGFDSLAECFGEMTKYIYSIETGLSSDPPMNWRLSALDNITLISNSDAHSPANLGREANVFEIADADLSYAEIRRIIKEKDLKKHKNICPVCKKKLTIGVLNRVAELADRKPGYISDKFIPYKNLAPLPEILAECFGVGKNSKKVQTAYEDLIKK